MFDWDAEYESIVKFYAQLAIRPGWREYTRGIVKEKMKTEPIFKNLGRDVGNRIKELESVSLLTTKEN